MHYLQELRAEASQQERDSAADPETDPTADTAASGTAMHGRVATANNPLLWEQCETFMAPQHVPALLKPVTATHTTPPHAAQHVEISPQAPPTPPPGPLPFYHTHAVVPPTAGVAVSAPPPLTATHSSRRLVNTTVNDHGSTSLLQGAAQAMDNESTTQHTQRTSAATGFQNLNPKPAESVLGNNVEQTACSSGRNNSIYMHSNQRISPQPSTSNNANNNNTKAGASKWIQQLDPDQWLKDTFGCLTASEEDVLESTGGAGSSTSGAAQAPAERVINASQEDSEVWLNYFVVGAPADQKVLLTTNKQKTEVPFPQVARELTQALIALFKCLFYATMQ